MKRVSAFVLALVMCLSLLPAAVPAEESAGAEPVLTGTDTWSSSAQPEDHDALLTAYACSRLGIAVEEAEGPQLDGRKPLENELDKYLYKELKACIEKVAAGSLKSTEFEITPDFGKYSWTAEELGVSDLYGDFNAAANALFLQHDLDALLGALMADLPYELYWYDKVAGTSESFGMSTGYNDSGEYAMGFDSFTFQFSVAQEYAAGDYSVKTSVGASVQSAADNARSIVAKYASASDYQKLLGYKNEICARASYNNGAAADPSTPFGNPWQLIWALDDDPDTTVVCEGYSKAFQYLCDLTSFSGSVSCITVSGVMAGGTGAGNHMWNIVAMPDGNRYLVDVTNCDAGTVGADDLLFLAGTSGSVSEGYIFNCGGNYVGFGYDSSTLNTFYTKELTLAGRSYSPSASEPTAKPADTPEPPELPAQISLADAKVTVKKQTYTGEPLKPDPTVQLDGRTLEKDRDYTVSYKNNKAAGVATVTVMGTGDYIGTAKGTFKILTAKPAIKSVQNVSKGVKLTWKKVAGAKSYEISRKEAGGKWQSLGTVTKANFTDTSAEAGVKYAYRVRCVTKNDATPVSAFSKSKTITFVAPPALGSAKNVKSGIKLTWTESAGAAKYAVYRKAAGGSWEKIGVAKKTAYIDKTAESGVKYAYRVCCVKKDGTTVMSAYSGTKTVKRTK